MLQDGYKFNTPQSKGAYNNTARNGIKIAESKEKELKEESKEVLRRFMLQLRASSSRTFFSVQANEVATVELTPSRDV
jgi:hypothetical protein